MLSELLPLELEAIKEEGIRGTSCLCLKIDNIHFLEQGARLHFHKNFVVVKFSPKILIPKHLFFFLPTLQWLYSYLSLPTALGREKEVKLSSVVTSVGIFNEN